MFVSGNNVTYSTHHVRMVQGVVVTVIYFVCLVYE